MPTAMPSFRDGPLNSGLPSSAILVSKSPTAGLDGPDPDSRSDRIQRKAISRFRVRAFHARPGMTTRSLLILRLVQLAIVDVADRDRPSRQRATEVGGEFHGNAGAKRGVDRLQISVAGVGRDTLGREGDAGRPDHLPGALEAEAHRHLHALMRGVGWRRRPAGAQLGEEIADRVEIVVGPPVLGL